MHANGTAPTSPEPHAAAVLEAYGMSCGRLEMLLWARMRELKSGEVLEVRSDEIAAREGVPSWSWLTGHPLVGTVEEDVRHTRFYLRKK